jgi:hypothetical protein
VKVAGKLSGESGPNSSASFASRALQDLNRDLVFVGMRHIANLNALE